MRFSGKTVLITGGGRGIGAACAVAFAREGAQIVITSRTRKELQMVEREIQAVVGADCTLAIRSDISDPASVKKLFNETLKTFGPVDILINNAAIAPVIDFMKLDVKS